MLIRRLCTTSVVLGFALIVSCGSDKKSGTPEGGGVGAMCSADSQCTGYSKPACVTSIKPLENLVTSTDPKDQPFKDFNLPFPDGYCSTTIENACTADADCGAGAGCFLAFEGVPQTTIDSLNKTGLPFDVSAFSKIGICLKPCTADTDCRASEGYACIRPLNGFLKLFNNSYTKTFCAVSVDDQIATLLGTPKDGG